MPSISSALDETIAQLEALHKARREREAGTLELLRLAVARLDVVTPGVTDDEPPPRHERRPEGGAGASPYPTSMPFVPLPVGSKPFGSAVRAKLTAEALAKGGW